MERSAMAQMKKAGSRNRVDLISESKCIGSKIIPRSRVERGKLGARETKMKRGCIDVIQLAEATTRPHELRLALSRKRLVESQESVGQMNPSV